MKKNKRDIQFLLKRFSEIGLKAGSPEEIRKIILTKYDGTFLTKEFLSKRRSN